MHGKADISRRATDVRALRSRLHPSLASSAVAQHADGHHAQVGHDLPPGNQVQKQRLQAFCGAHAHVEQVVYATT